MTLAARIKLASAVCVVSFVVAVITVFLNWDVESLFFYLGLFSGFLAAKWQRQLAAQNGVSPPPVFGMASNSTKWWITLLTLPFYAFLTIALFWIGGHRLYLVHVFNVDSIKTNGTIVSRSKTGVRPVVCALTYDYTDRQGLGHQKQERVSMSTWFALAETNSVPVKYLPDHPATSRIDLDLEDRTEGGSAFFVIVIGVVFLGMGVWLYSYYLSKLR